MSTIGDPSGTGSPYAALMAMPFFAGLDAAALERVASGTRIRRFRRGEVVFHVGDPGDALFLISTGSVKITLPSESGEEAILATLQPGEVFGELSLLDGAPRRRPLSRSSRPRRSSSSAIGSGTSWPRSRRSATRSSRTWPPKCATDAHVEDLHFLDVTGRLAKCLVRLAEEGRPDGNGGIRLRRRSVRANWRRWSAARARARTG